MGVSAAITGSNVPDTFGRRNQTDQSGQARWEDSTWQNLGGYGLGFGVGGLLVNSFADRLSYAFW